MGNFFAGIGRWFGGVWAKVRETFEPNASDKANLVHRAKAAGRGKVLAARKADEEQKAKQEAKRLRRNARARARRAAKRLVAEAKAAKEAAKKDK